MQPPLTPAEEAVATGDAVTAGTLAHPGAALQQLRLMGYHNSRLLLALRTMLPGVDDPVARIDADRDGALTAAAMAEAEARMQRLADQCALQATTGAEAAAAMQKERDDAVAEAREARAAVGTAGERIRVLEAEAAALRLQVAAHAAAEEELAVLRRTHGELAAELRVAQRADPEVRFVHADPVPPSALSPAPGDEPPTTPSGHPHTASVSTDRSAGSAAPTEPTGVSVACAARLRWVEESEEAARCGLLVQGLDYHYLLAVLRDQEATALDAEGRAQWLTAECDRLAAVADAQVEAHTALRVEAVAVAKHRDALEEQLSRTPSEGQVWDATVGRLEHLLTATTREFQSKLDAAYRAGLLAGQREAVAMVAGQRRPLHAMDDVSSIASSGGPSGGSA